MDGLKELVEALSARIKSPIVGSIVLAFVIVNWKPLFFLLFSGAPAVTKFAFYDGNMTGSLPYVSPVIIGLAFALLLPWVNFWGAKAVEAPITWHRNMQLDAAHAETEKKTRHAIDMETVSAEHRRVLLESARVNQEIKDADIDDDVRTELEGKLVETKGAEFVEAADQGTVQKPLSEAAVTLLVSTAKGASGRVSFSHEGEDYFTRSGAFETSNFGYTVFDPKDAINRKIFLIAQEAVGELVRNGYMEQASEDAFDLTTEGYGYLEKINAEESKAK